MQPLFDELQPGGMGRVPRRAHDLGPDLAVFVVGEALEPAKREFGSHVGERAGDLDEEPLVVGAAVLVAHVSGADPDRSATAAILFVGLRVLHAVFYLANLDVLRSIVFLGSMGAVIWLFVLAASA